MHIFLRVKFEVRLFIYFTKNFMDEGKRHFFMGVDGLSLKAPVKKGWPFYVRAVVRSLLGRDHGFISYTTGKTTT